MKTDQPQPIRKIDFFHGVNFSLIHNTVIYDQPSSPAAAPDTFTSQRIKSRSHCPYPNIQTSLASSNDLVIILHN
jgi:hypothetical protein